MLTARLLPVSPRMHCSRGVYLVLRGVPGLGDVPAWGYLPRGGLCTWSRGCTCPGECTWSGGCTCPGVPALGGDVPGLGGVYLVQGRCTCPGVPGPGGCTWSGGCTCPGGCTWSQGGAPGPGVYLPRGVGGAPGPERTCPGTAPPWTDTHV